MTKSSKEMETVQQVLEPAEVARFAHATSMAFEELQAKLGDVTVVRPHPPLAIISNIDMELAEELDPCGDMRYVVEFIDWGQGESPQHVRLVCQCIHRAVQEAVQLCGEGEPYSLLDVRPAAPIERQVDIAHAGREMADGLSAALSQSHAGVTEAGGDQ